MLLARTVIALSLAVFALAAPKGDILGNVAGALPLTKVASSLLGARSQILPGAAQAASL
jgi:hypothetical protein